MNSTKVVTQDHSLGEELANAITHGVGVVLSITGLVFMMMMARPGYETGFAIYGSSLVLLYLTSTLYHSLTFTRARALFRKFDHMAIFILIAGTYTPFCLSVLKGWTGWIMLAAVWLLAVLGILLKSVFTGRFEWLSVLLYAFKGWMVILVIKPVYAHLPTDGFILLVGGGIAYTLGILFYLKSGTRYFHSIWHLWVLAGSIMHFFSILTLIEM